MVPHPRGDFPRWRMILSPSGLTPWIWCAHRMCHVARHVVRHVTWLHQTRGVFCREPWRGQLLRGVHAGSARQERMQAPSVVRLARGPGHTAAGNSPEK